MKKKTSVKRLTLNKETLVQLEHVVGQATQTANACSAFASCVGTCLNCSKLDCMTFYPQCQQA